MYTLIDNPTANSTWILIPIFTSVQVLSQIEPGFSWTPTRMRYLLVIHTFSGSDSANAIRVDQQNLLTTRYFTEY